MVDIRQLTNYDVAGTAATTTKTILKAGTLTSWRYYIIPLSMLEGEITKMGYCCEVKGIAYPIFLTINGIETEFQIGKTGMFEFQDETWKNVNVSETDEYIAQVTATEVKVPVNIKFVLDYTYNK